MIKPLDISIELFSSMEASGIKYCHWKSNEHLLDGLAGYTDLDILVDKNEHEIICSLLTNCNCKKVLSQPWCQYPDIEDWIGYDKQSGKLIHIHLHYKLLMGYKYVKELHLPYECLVLNDAIKDNNYHVHKNNPELELVLLIIRIALKTDLSQIILSLYKSSFLPGNIVSEYSYLKELINWNVFTEYLGKLFGNKDADIISEAVRHNTALSSLKILAIKRIVGKRFNDQMRYNLFNIKKTFLLKKLHFIFSKNKNRYITPAQIKKTFSGQGVIIAIIGCDGSGKTSIVKALTEWLSWKVDVESVYLGSGEGDVGFIIRLKRQLDNVIKNVKKKKIQIKNRDQKIKTQKNPLRAFINHLILNGYYFAIAKERYKKIRRAQKARTIGKIVLTDRYPQNCYEGIYDGPYIKSQNDRLHILGWLKRKEKDLYVQMSKLPPDIVIKLNIPFEVSRIRKPHEEISIIKKKIEIHKKISFTGAKKVEIDAAQTFEKVLVDVKSAIWKYV